MLILFNGDDFGLTQSITDGIIKAHTDGVVGSTTLIMNGRACKYAVKKARENPTLKIGIHLVLTWGKPLNKNVPDLVDDDGFFKFSNRFETMNPPNIKQVEKEWQTQIEAFLSTGIPLHHMDSHHHIHGWSPLKDVVIRLAHKYNVPVRFVDSLKDHPDILLTEKLWSQFYGDGISVDIFSQLKELDVKSVEVMTHPAYMDDDLRKVSSYNTKRVTELDILSNLIKPDWANLIR